jgi:hypothetical protein
MNHVQLGVVLLRKLSRSRDCCVTGRREIGCDQDSVQDFHGDF